jgi:hypothetical protein
LELNWELTLQQWWDGALFYFNIGTMGSYTLRGIKVGFGQMPRVGMSKIDQGIEEATVLAFWTIFYCHDRFANSRLAPQPTPERSTERGDDSMARLCTTI